MFREYWGRGSVAFLTTNWDPLLGNELRTIAGEEPRVSYLHGKISEPDRMLLPGEIVAERYRSESDRQRMQGLMSMWRPIEQTRRIVIYGHSISAIEAELRVILCMGFSEATPGEILIVSLKKDANDIRQRILPLIPAGREWNIELQPVD